MALNFLTGSRSSTEEEAPETTESEPTTNTTEEDKAAEPARRRRGSRGGRSRSGSKASPPAPADEASEAVEEKPAAPRRATSRRQPKADSEEAPAAKPSRRRPATARTADEEEQTPPRAPRRRAAPAARTSEEAEEEKPKRATPRRRSRAATEAAESDNDALLAALKEQTETLSRLVQLQEQTIARLSGNGSAGKAAVGTPRVGVFVDSANVELARDRSRGGRPIDWGLVLKRVTDGRRLVRAIAYSPVHDDPGVSPETQRFVEPFLGKGFKIVTKPLKRFADGSIKANVDIELALDVITMAERLDIAVLVSGDGDFQHLVEVLQSRGVRVEVAGLGQSVASNLKKAADEYIELDFAQKK